MSPYAPQDENDVADAQKIHCNGVAVFLLKIPQSAIERTPEAVQRQRVTARDALKLCARELGAPTDGWSQSPDGAPIPNNGWHWSISHKRSWAGAVISRDPIGLDIEAIQPRHNDLYGKVGSDREWDRLGGRTWDNFFTLWTAKEATLKANGVGIGLLSECRIERVESDVGPHMIASFAEQSWRIEHVYFNGHVAAVARINK